MPAPPSTTGPAPRHAVSPAWPAAELLYMGIDGGGTGCRARLRAADGTLLGKGFGGPANIRLGVDRAWSAMMDAVGAALAQAGLEGDAQRRLRLGLGLAGVLTQEDKVRTQAAAPPFASVTVEGDAHIACLGAFSGRDGGIVIAGTGSAGHAVVNGRGHTIGGWGFAVSDEGGGADMGRAAIRAALRGHDGMGPDTAFTRQVRVRLGGSPAAIVDWVERAEPADYGSLAPLVLEYAALGDPVARAVGERSAAALDDLVGHLHRLGAPRLCLMGGLAAPLTPWLAPATRALLTRPDADSLEGALLLAGLPARR